MKVVVDTNVFFSALFHPSEQFTKLMEYLFTECETLIPEYVADELLSKAIRKHPERASLAMNFLESIGALTPDADSRNPENITIRDPKDQPILDAALLHGVDIVISGDKHFQSLEIDRPRIMKPADFIAEFIDNRT